MSQKLMLIKALVQRLPMRSRVITWLWRKYVKNVRFEHEMHFIGSLRVDAMAESEIAALAKHSPASWTLQDVCSFG